MVIKSRLISKLLKIIIKYIYEQIGNNYENYNDLIQVI